MTIIRMTEAEALKKYRLTPALRGKIHATKERDVDLSEMPSGRMLEKMYRPGRPAVENPKVVLSFRADKDVADGLRGLKNWSSLANDEMRKYLIKLGAL